MYLNHLETSKEARLTQILHTLKSVHGVQLNINMEASSTEDFLNECKSAWENKRDRIVAESNFNSYQQNPEYIKSMLILEAVRLMLTEIGPKRRRRKQMAESTTATTEADMNQGPTNKFADDLGKIAERIPQTSEEATMFSIVLASIARKAQKVGALFGTQAKDFDDDEKAVLAWIKGLPRPINVNSMIQDGIAKFGPELLAKRKATLAAQPKIDLGKDDMEEGKDQDSDGDEDFADVMVARMTASGMPKGAAIAKTKGKPYNKESISEDADPDSPQPQPAPSAVSPVVGQAHHYEYQASMARSELYRNSKYAMSMLKQVDPKGEVEPWIAGALTKAANLLDKVYHYLDYYKKFEPQELPEGDEDTGLGETSGGVTRQNLMLIMEYSIKLFDMIKPGDKLEGWVAMKLTTASECVSSCKHYMDYVQFEHHAMDNHFSEGMRANRKITNETAYERDLDEKKPVYADYLYGVKSIPKKKKFRNYAEYEKWMDTFGDNVEVQRVYNESRSLMEQENLAKAATIISAKDMSGNLQDMAEDVAKMSVEDLMPLVDMIRTHFGSEIADGFNTSVKSALESLLDLSAKTKNTLDNSIESLIKGGVPAEATDIETAGEEPEPGAEEEPADDSDISKDLADLGSADGSTEEEPEADTGEPLGRAKKSEVAESISVGKKVNVTNPKATPRHEVIKIEGDQVTVRKPDGKEVTLPMARIMRANPGLTEGKKATPDFLDVDKGGNKKEPMKKTIVDKKGNTKKIDEAAEKVAKIKQKDGSTGWTVYVDDRGEYKTIGFKSSKEDAQKVADKFNEKMKKYKLEEKAPPGKKAEDFIKGNKAEFKQRYGDKWQERLYATAWKKFGKHEESYAKAGHALAEAKAELDRLEKSLAEHRAEFKTMLAEGKVSDPLHMGYGLEGDSIMAQMTAANKRMNSAKTAMTQLMKEGVIGMLMNIQSLNKARSLEATKNLTPYGVLYTTAAGRKSKKMFESADARAYWLELKSGSIIDPRMIEPETFDSAITRTKKG